MLSGAVLVPLAVFGVVLTDPRAARLYHVAALRIHVAYAAIPASGPFPNNQDRDFLGYTRRWHSAHADHHGHWLAAQGEADAGR